MKKCTLCLKEKEISEFYKNKLAKDHLFRRCKVCCNRVATELSKLKRIKSVELIPFKDEIFKPIKYNKNYFISNLGRAYVKEHFSTVFIRGKLLKLTVLCTGYQTISIDRKKYLIHRLVAEHFIKKRIGRNVVNHKDSNRINNNVSNLEWVTCRENILHGVGKDNYSVKLNRENVIEIRKSNLSVRELSSIYKVSDTNIRLIISRKIWKHI